MFKGIPIIMLAVWAGYSLYCSFRLLPALVCAGILLCLAGDFFLLKPDRFFLHGLGAFLTGHIAYFSAFITAGHRFSFLSLIIIFPCALFFLLFLKQMNLEGKKKFLPAIAVYFCVVVCMTVVAVSYDLQSGSLSWFSLGASVFCFSDAVLAWTLFVRRTVFLDGAVIASYYFAQAVIVIAASMKG